MRLFCVHSFIALWRNFFSAMSRGRAQGHLQCLPQQVWFSLQKIGFLAVKVAGKTRFQKNMLRFYRKCGLGQQTFVKSNIEKKVTRAKKGDFFKKQSVSSKCYSKFSLFISTGVHLLTKSGKICKLQVQKHCHISTVCPAN